MKRNGKIAIMVILAVAAFFLLKPYIIGKGGKKVEKVEVRDSVTVSPVREVDDGTAVPVVVKPVERPVVPKKTVKPAVKPPEEKKPVKKKKGKERENLDINI